MPHQFGAVEPVDMQIAARLVGHQSPVAVPPGLANHQPEPDRLQRRHVILLTVGVGDRQVDVNHAGTDVTAPGGAGTSVIAVRRVCGVLPDGRLTGGRESPCCLVVWVRAV